MFKLRKVANNLVFIIIGIFIINITYAAHWVRGYTRRNGTYVARHMSGDPGEGAFGHWHHNVYYPNTTSYSGYPKSTASSYSAVTPAPVANKSIFYQKIKGTISSGDFGLVTHCYTTKEMYDLLRKRIKNKKIDYPSNIKNLNHVAYFVFEGVSFESLNNSCDSVKMNNNLIVSDIFIGKYKDKSFTGVKFTSTSGSICYATPFI